MKKSKQKGGGIKKGREKINEKELTRKQRSNAKIKKISKASCKF